MMSQAVLYDSDEDQVHIGELHRVLKDVVVQWYAAHLARTPESFVVHLKEKYPKGASYAKDIRTGKRPFVGPGPSGIFPRAPVLK